MEAPELYTLQPMLVLQERSKRCWMQGKGSATCVVNSRAHLPCQVVQLMEAALTRSRNITYTLVMKRGKGFNLGYTCSYNVNARMSLRTCRKN